MVASACSTARKREAVAPSAGSIELRAELRIAARRLADGRVGFALQQQIDGEWGARLLASARLLRDAAELDRRLSSSAATIPAVSRPPAN